jgi:hypothetical protein
MLNAHTSQDAQPTLRPLMPIAKPSPSHVPQMESLVSPPSHVLSTLLPHSVEMLVIQEPENVNGTPLEQDHAETTLVLKEMPPTPPMPYVPLTYLVV